MIELTPTRMDDAVSEANTFLEYERSTQLEGAGVALEIAQAVRPVAEHAESVLTAIPYPNRDGFYLPLSKYNAAHFDEVNTALINHAVLVHASTAGEQGVSEFYPAIVSSDSLQSRSMRLHVLHHPYRRHMNRGASVVLSAAGQSEAPGVGGRHNATDPEHFTTILAAGDDPSVSSGWKRGVHVNHDWRKDPTDSATTELSKRLFGRNIPQTTLTLRKPDIVAGHAQIFWHEGLRSLATGKPEVADTKDALVVVQGLGFQAAKTQRPRSLDTLKQVMQT